MGPKCHENESMPMKRAQVGGSPSPPPGPYISYGDRGIPGGRAAVVVVVLKCSNLFHDTSLWNRHEGTASNPSVLVLYVVEIVLYTRG